MDKAKKLEVYQEVERAAAFISGKINDNEHTAIQLLYDLLKQNGYTSIDDKIWGYFKEYITMRCFLERAYNYIEGKSREDLKEALYTMYRAYESDYRDRLLPDYLVRGHILAFLEDKPLKVIVVPLEPAKEDKWRLFKKVFKAGQ